MKTFYIILSVTLAYAEPPSNQYLPALKGFTSPSLPSVTPLNYGTPVYTPPSNYGVPTNTYGIPTNTYGIPTNTYGIPTAPAAIYGEPISRQPLAVTPTSLQGRPLFNPNINLAYGAPVYTISRPKYGAPKYLPPYGVDAREPANYNFKYDVHAPEYGTEFGHEEARQGDVAQGRYYTLLPDGRRQIVEYVADAGGYRPKISYEQVGYPQAAGGYQY